MKNHIVKFYRVRKIPLNPELEALRNIFNDVIEARQARLEINRLECKYMEALYGIEACYIGI